MGGWTLAHGKDAEQTLGGAVAAGATQIALTGADTIFAVGELLFMSEADGTEAEFLGAVSAVSPTAVDFKLPVVEPKAAGAKLWRPQSSLALSAEAHFPFQRKVSTGVEVERSLGGTVFAIQTAEPSETMIWTLDELTDEREATLADWLSEEIQGGLRAFTLVEPGRKIAAVRLAEGRFTRFAKAGGRRGLEAPLMVEGDGQYR